VKDERTFLADPRFGPRALEAANSIPKEFLSSREETRGEERCGEAKRCLVPLSKGAGGEL